MDAVSYLLSKRYIEDSLQGAGALVGKSAYDIACENGFSGTPTEWLNTLKGETPTISATGTWMIGNQDTGVIASPSLAGFATELFVHEQISKITIPEVDLNNYITREQLAEALLGISLPNMEDYVTLAEFEQAISSIIVPDMSLYATKDFVQELFDSLNIPEGGAGMIALTREEILDICQ